MSALPLCRALALADRDGIARCGASARDSLDGALLAACATAATGAAIHVEDVVRKPTHALLIALVIIAASCQAPPPSTSPSTSPSASPATSPATSSSTSSSTSTAQQPAATGTGTSVTPEQVRSGGLAPLPSTLGDARLVTDARVQLGRQLFFDTRLSVNGTQSCNTCHALGRFGAESTSVSTGASGSKGTRNAPTVLNAAGHFAQFWDARAPNVEEQAKGPILNPIEMGMKDDQAVVAVLQSIPGYRPLFAAAFPGEQQPITFDNYAKAVGAFERKLVTPARLDAFLNGDDNALTSIEKKGAATFMQAGCTACHSGAFMGGQMMQKLGVVVAWPNQQDVGRAQVTKADADKMFFKVPSLRNVTKTAPYFHDGSVATIDDAVRAMARHQLGRTLSDDDTKAIVAFLDATAGSAPASLVSTPTPVR